MIMREFGLSILRMMYPLLCETMLRIIVEFLFVIKSSGTKLDIANNFVLDTKEWDLFCVQSQ